jgi:hypothetical protein
MGSLSKFRLGRRRCEATEEKLLYYARAARVCSPLSETQRRRGGCGRAPERDVNAAKFLRLSARSGRSDRHPQ